jgi:hypothetical protein
MTESWLWAVTLIVCALTLLAAMAIALRGSDPKDRPEILRALAELLRRGGGSGPRLPPPDGPDHRS